MGGKKDRKKTEQSSTEEEASANDVNTCVVSKSKDKSDRKRKRQKEYMDKEGLQEDNNNDCISEELETRKKKKKKLKHSSESETSSIEKTKKSIDKSDVDKQISCENAEKKMLKEVKRQKRKLKDIENAETELGDEIIEYQAQLEEKKRKKKLEKENDESSGSKSSEEEEEEEEEKEDSEPILKDEKLKKKKKKTEKNKKEKKSREEENQGSITAAILYLQTWKTKRKKWAFKKVRQVWLLQHMYNNEMLPDCDFDVMLEYLQGLQGSARKTTIERAEEFLNKDEDENSDTSMDLERVKRVLQILS